MSPFRPRAAAPGAGRALLSAVCLILGGAASLGAQADPLGRGDAAPGPPVGLEATAFVGWISSLADLSEDPDAFSTAIDPYVAVGADAVFWFSERFGLGVTGVFAPSELGTRATQPDLPAPEDLGGVDYLAGVANLVYRIPISGTASAVRPYFAVGAGLRHLEIAESARPDLESSTDPAATIAGGVRLDVLGDVQLRMEVRDFMSSYEAPGTGESTFQNDIAVTVGFGTRVP